ncbi:hypothetical protein AAIB41_03510 [Brucella sp. BE17]|uniref:hypothetical protein n=1 Tax=Brucella sp. BE17 TaxID=3142977 RepID=UPI0031BB5B99
MRFGFAAAAMALLSSSVRGLFGGASLPLVSIPPMHRHSRGSKRIRLGGRTYKPNGAREVARRQRQIAEGRLTASSGVT